NSVTLEYPKQQIAMSPARMRILYFIAGCLLSRIWKHVRRDKVGGVGWMWFVDRHKYSSAQDAIRCEGELTDVVREVDWRNEPKGGTGLSFPTKVFLDFVLTLESGYYHILSQPFLLGAYRGDFPEEILRVILESPAVQSSWAACWTARDGDGEAIAVDPKVSREVFEFVTRKYQNCRMGDWTRRVSRMTSISKAQASVALRTELKV
ncbi:unnamed protein product, partial [Pylaiella littoralis]